MKRALLVLNLLIIINLHVTGQTKSEKFNIQWGPEQKEAKKSVLSDIVGFDRTGIYVHKRNPIGNSFSKTAFTLEQYGLSMSPTKSEEIGLKAQGKVAELETILYLDNTIYVFSSNANNKAKRYYLYVQPISKNTLQLEKEAKQIAEMDYSGSSKYSSGEFHISISEDSSKVFVHHKSPYDEKENEKCEFYVLDKKMNQVWKKSITLPYKNNLFEVERYEVDNQGNVHLVGVLYNDKKTEKRMGKPNFKYQILSYYDNGNELKEYPVSLDGKFITDMKIAFNDKQELLCGGFYSSPGSFNIEGSYFLKINSQTKEIISKDTKSFGADFITQYFSEKEEKEAKKEAKKGMEPDLYKYELKNMIFSNDGNIWLIGEQFYIQSVLNQSSDGQGNINTYTTFIYHHNDIIITNISPDGKIAWSNKIAKRQVDRTDDGIFSSYFLFSRKDNLLFVFNDNASNLKYNGEGKPANFENDSESIVTLVTVDKQGNQNRESLFTAADANVLTQPLVCEQISAKDMVILGQKKKTHRFAKVTFKEAKP